jgi:hypothetical protein
VKRAQECLDLAEQKMIGSSYGYDPELFDILPGEVRRLKQIRLREVSNVSFPANDLAQILSVKGRYTSYPSYQKQAALASMDKACGVLESMAAKHAQPSPEEKHAEWLRERREIMAREAAFTSRYR